MATAVTGLYASVSQLEECVYSAVRMKKRLVRLLERVVWIKDYFKNLEVAGKNAGSIGQRLVERYAGLVAEVVDFVKKLNDKGWPARLWKSKDYNKDAIDDYNQKVQSTRDGLMVRYGPGQEVAFPLAIGKEDIEDYEQALNEVKPMTREDLGQDIDKDRLIKTLEGKVKEYSTYEKLDQDQIMAIAAVNIAEPAEQEKVDPESSSHARDSVRETMTDALPTAMRWTAPSPAVQDGEEVLPFAVVTDPVSARNTAIPANYDGTEYHAAYTRQRLLAICFFIILIGVLIGVEVSRVNLAFYSHSPTPSPTTPTISVSVG
jgi:hypothetical protein